MRELAALLMLMSVSANAETVFRCDTEKGTVFSQQPCGENARQIRVRPEGFVLPGSDIETAERLDRLRALREARREAREEKAFNFPDHRRERLGYGERAELRRLRMRRDSLQRDLRTSAEGSLRHKRARERLQDINGRISELEARE